jgi:hypothetical protein
MSEKILDHVNDQEKLIIGPTIDNSKMSHTYSTHVLLMPNWSNTFLILRFELCEKRNYEKFLKLIN